MGPLPRVFMRIIKAGRVYEFCEQYPEAADWLGSFLAVAKAAKWKNIQEVRHIYPHADAVKVASGSTVTVLNVKGNHYRLVLAIHYNRGIVFVLRFMPHDEYSRGQWKRTL